MQHVQGAQVATSGHDPGPDGPSLSLNSSQHRLITASLQSLAQEMNDIAEQASALLTTPAGRPSTDSEAFTRIARRTVPRWHFAMLNDTERNDALAGALARGIPSGATVLDIGSGSGLLAMAAARAARPA